MEDLFNFLFKYIPIDFYIALVIERACSRVLRLLWEQSPFVNVGICISETIS